MDAKFVNPFLTSLENVLSMFGATDVKKSELKLKEEMAIEKEVTSFIGVVGKVRGNVSYSFSKETALNIVSAMMGMQVDELNELARSGIAEFSNMLAGNAASLFSEDSKTIDITTPTVIQGEDVFAVLSSVKTLMVNFETSFGNIEINIGLEI